MKTFFAARIWAGIGAEGMGCDWAISIGMDVIVERIRSKAASWTSFNMAVFSILESAYSVGPVPNVRFGRK